MRGDLVAGSGSRGGGDGSQTTFCVSVCAWYLFNLAGVLGYTVAAILYGSNL